ncbi:MAG: lycopene cyclase domain-containing protein [Aquiluna sp.]
MSYPLLTVIVLSIFAVYSLLMRRWIDWTALVPAGLFMLLMTLVFDNLIIANGIVDYDLEKTAGIRLFLAPIEDFAYTLVALVLVPSLFNLFRSKL